MNFNILSIDGGGIRGIYPAYILYKIENELGIKISDHFDMVIGTSTGSIIASAIAIDYSIEDIVNLFEKKSKDIFNKRIFSLGGTFKSRYDIKNLKEILELILGSRILSDSKILLTIPATDIKNEDFFIFRSYDSPDSKGDRDVKISDAVLSSCSAPTYFDPQKIGFASYNLADGGLWANNPSFLAYFEAINILNKSTSDIKILSIGTGQSQVNYDDNSITSNKWGLFANWGGGKILELILNLQSLNDTKRIQSILGENYLRINYETQKDLPLDSIKIIEDMKNRGDYSFSKNKIQLSEYFGVVTKNNNSTHLKKAKVENNNIILEKEAHICELFQEKMLCTHAFYLRNMASTPSRFPLTDYDGSYIEEDLNITYDFIERSILDDAKITPVINGKVAFAKINEYPSGGEVFVGEWAVEIDKPLLPNERIVFYRKNKYTGHVIAHEGEVSFKPRVPCNELCIIIDEKSGKKIEIMKVLQADGFGKYFEVDYEHEKIVDSVIEKITIRNTNPIFRYILKIKRS